MTLDEVLAALVEHARPLMLGGGHLARLDSCIAMTRCAIEVLRVFGVEARPLNVEVLITNKTFMDLLAAGRIRLEEPLPDWAVDEGAWGIGLGLRPTGDEGGHVVAIIDEPGGGIVVDLSLDQAARPAKAIKIGPHATRFADDGSGTFALVTDEGASVSYKLRPDFDTWSTSPDWRQFDRRYRRETGRIIRAVRATSLPL